MDLVLRAFDQDGLDRAERLPVRRLWTLLESGGLRDAAKARVGLTADLDVFARETIVARMEALVQEGYGEENVRRLRGGDPIDLATLRRAHWPALGREEAVELREDFVRYFTYGLWRSPEQVVARALALLTGSSDISFLLGGAEATAGLQAVLDSVGEEEDFTTRYAASVRLELKRSGAAADDISLAKEMARLGQLFGPLSRMMRAAIETDLRVIAYQDTPGGDGLTHFLDADMDAGRSGMAALWGDVPAAHVGEFHGNGYDEA